MALNNLISVQFTDDELMELDEGLTKIENVLRGKTHNLTPDERRQFGRIAEQNKLFVNKAKGYMDDYPEFIPRYIDTDEFDRDYHAREVIENRLTRLQGLSEQLSDTKVLLDHDNYNNAISFYRVIRLLSRENVPGTTHVYQGLRQFFSGGRPIQDNGEPVPETPAPLVEE